MLMQPLQCGGSEAIGHPCTVPFISLTPCVSL